MPQPADLHIPYVDQASVEVDARRDEGVWASAMKVPDGFLQFQPRPDTPPTGDTEVWLLADRLYLYWVAHDPEPDKIRASLGRRDTRFDDDFVGFYVDPTGTRRART